MPNPATSSASEALAQRTLVGHPSSHRAGPARTKEPQSAGVGSSSTIPAPEPRASIPSPGEGSEPHTPALQTWERLQSRFSHSFLVPARVPALKPAALFLSRAIQAGRKIPRGRCPRAVWIWRPQGAGALPAEAARSSLVPKVILAAAEAAGKTVTGSRRRHEWEKRDGRSRATQGRGGFLGRGWVPPTPGKRGRGDGAGRLRGHPALLSLSRPVDRTEGEGGGLRKKVGYFF